MGSTIGIITTCSVPAGTSVCKAGREMKIILNLRILLYQVLVRKAKENSLAEQNFIDLT